MPETRGYSLEAIQDGFRRPPMSKILTRLVDKVVGKGTTAAPGGQVDSDGDDVFMSGALEQHQESEGSTALPSDLGFELGSVTQRIEVAST